MIRSIWIFSLALFIFSCKSSKKEKLEIRGTFKNLESLAATNPEIFKNGTATIFLYEVPLGIDAQPIQLDSILLKKGEEKFTLKSITKGEGMYDIVIDRGGPMIPLINDVDQITIDADFSKKDQFYTIKGSDASNDLRSFIVAYSEKGNQINQSLTVLDSLKKINASDSLQIIAAETKNNKIDALNLLVKDQIRNASNPTLAIFVLGRASQTLPQNDFETILQDLLKKYADNKDLIQINKQFSAYKQQLKEEELKQQQSSLVGKPAPELELPDVNGKMIKISSFKGKYILVDFWASWCGPCRGENPNVVAAYQQFKNKNFTILGVSLDKDKAEWLKAIQDDGLTWTHISDLAYWNSAAVKAYGFEGIPFNVLIDPSGMIIAQGLRGEALSQKLQEVLK